MDQQAKRFATTPEKARIYVYRNNYIGHIFSQTLQLNGLDAGTLPGYSFMPLEVAPGKYKLFAKSENETSLELQVQSGKNYYVQLNASMGIWTFRSELRQTLEADARQAILDECGLVISSLYPLNNEKALPLSAEQTNSSQAPVARPGAATPPSASPELLALLRVQPASGYARPEDINRLPTQAKYRVRYEEFLANPKPTKALVLGDGGGFFSTGTAGLPELYKLFERCQNDGHKECWLYSWGTEVVWSEDKALRINRDKLNPLPATH
ncbi:DUF2846 domain-containing protein [Uliginosibacterium aquaticum]|uniref:DUF2846 domain-containing protein n=1 Tax=Uliginosibacterium aquaticum TaxID=2731212 RepID=A0ABX2II75_9RHOO|nr:DUF2846 domain-containing protein [Uliginosibacterium aquaticum]NSL55987.1 DUF2846 domain-containing protein [Uliginosibacterium aquaticum]